jgi:hypothetical protein
MLRDEIKKNKLRNTILNQSKVEGWNWKKKIKKEHKKRPESTGLIPSNLLFGSWDREKIHRKK